MRDIHWQVVKVIAILLSAVATVFAISGQYTTKPAFEEYKQNVASQFQSITSLVGRMDARLIRIEEKQDAILKEIREDSRPTRH